jgi:HAD superfamily hydrolase (TIGR01662 family)
MPIHVVLFDLGSTLIYAKDPWPPIYLRADRALAEVLRRARIRFDPQRFFAEHETFMEAYYAKRDGDNTEQTTFTALKSLLAEHGYRKVPDAILLAALDAEYAITQTNWFVEQDALPTLELLRKDGYRLGMISNTSYDKNVQQLVDRLGLRPFFEIVVTSAALGIRKPDRRIFQVALDHFRVHPRGVAMVGDTPSADLEGANRLGMYSVWITRRAGDPDPAIRPRATVSTLAEIPALLKNPGS